MASISIRISIFISVTSRTTQGSSVDIDVLLRRTGVPRPPPLWHGHLGSTLLPLQDWGTPSSSDLFVCMLGMAQEFFLPISAALLACILAFSLLVLSPDGCQTFLAPLGCSEVTRHA